MHISIMCQVAGKASEIVYITMRNSVQSKPPMQVNKSMPFSDNFEKPAIVLVVLATSPVTS